MRFWIWLKRAFGFGVEPVEEETVPLFDVAGLDELLVAVADNLDEVAAAVLADDMPRLFDARRRVLLSFESMIETVVTLLERVPEGSAYAAEPEPVPPPTEAELRQLMSNRAALFNMLNAATKNPRAPLTTPQALLMQRLADSRNGDLDIDRYWDAG